MNSRQVVKFSIAAVLVAFLSAFVALPAQATNTQATADDPTPLTGEFQVNTISTGDQYSMDVAVDNDGNFVVVYESQGQIYARRFNNQAQALGQEFVINETTEDTLFSPKIAMNSSGNFVVAWGANGGLNVKARAFNNQGSPLSDELTMENSTYSQGHDVAIDAMGNFVVTYTDQQYVGEFLKRVKARVYKLNGDLLSAEVDVEPDAATLEQVFPSVAMTIPGTYVVVWSDWSEVWGRMLSLKGQPLGKSFRVNNAVRDDQLYPDIAADHSGDFVVAWYRSGHWSKEESDVYARTYDSMGRPKGKQFRVNSYLPGWQLNPSVSLDAAGNFIISWRSEDQDGSSGGIYGQQYNHLGKAVGNEFQINTTTYDSQQEPKVALANNGRFVVIWTSWYQDGSGWGLYGRLYQSATRQRPIYATLSGSGETRGVQYQTGDILVFDPANEGWSMYFDASDMGLNQNLSAFDVQPNGDLFLAFQKPQSINGLGTVAAHDIVRFKPTSIGENTAGSFDLYFDGSDVDLSGGGEQIDAIAFEPGGDLLISTTGGVKVTGVQALDEDLLQFTPTSMGENTAGNWQLYFDGSDEGIKKDLIGAWVEPESGDLYLSFERAVKLDGVKIPIRAIARCRPISLGSNTNCQGELYWLGNISGIGGAKLLGISLGSP